LSKPVTVINSAKNVKKIFPLSEKKIGKTLMLVNNSGSARLRPSVRKIKRKNS